MFELEKVDESEVRNLVHDAESQIVEEKAEVEAQGFEEKARDEYTNVGEVDTNSDELIEEPMVITDECPIVTPVCDQPADEKQDPDKEEI